MAKANLQDQARDLGLSEEGTVDELRAEIEASGNVPDDDYVGQDSVSEGQTPGPSPEANGEPGEESASEAGKIVIPEFEDRINRAAAAGDNDELARIQDEYNTAREEQSQE